MLPKFHILLIEDSAADAQIIARALRDDAVPHVLTVHRDGRSALDSLRRPPVADAGPGPSPPDLILLDLNLPGLDGTQVLAEIKTDPALRTIPVVVLTTSRRDEDILQTYQAGANSYIPKPSEYPSYRELVGVLRKYWHETALRVPRRYDP
jgi:chemotaxis family two-component system response regulator Rcp1